MGLRFVGGRFFQLGDGSDAIFPTASEIQNVVFENGQAIRNHPVSAEDFLRTGIEFVEYLADPLVIVEYRATEGHPTISCRFVARSGIFEANVARADSTLLDYGIVSNRWLALPSGATAEALDLLATLRLSDFGQISLGQYMKLGRLNWSGIMLDDRTGEAFTAASIAPLLRGEVPAGFVGRLYPYQLDGYRWLSFMTENGLGGVVADEMGLGKTIQVICLLLEAQHRSRRPNLILTPTTLLENWRRELAKFGPSLRVQVHSGKSRTGDPADLIGYDVVICSIETAVVDVALLRNIQWYLLVVDEAQNIRNPNARRTVQVKTIQRECAIAVTGTPIENRLQDLWSITDFVIPSLLGSLSQFEHRHPETISGASMVEPVASPIILRRTIQQVADDLPEKIEIPQALEMDAESAQAYEGIRTAAASQMGRGAGLGVLQTLRMFCTHPWLTGHFTNVADPANCSVKIRRLFEIMEEVVASNGKALIFTSFSESVDLIHEELATRFGIFCSTIDGRVAIPMRQKRVDEFSAYDGPGALVMNPKAAGVGLNITAANHVIHYNLEWNPAVEDQASARAHRRGQTKVVTVHRLFYAHTVEEVMDDRMQTKRQIADAAIVGTSGRDQEMSDLLRALRVSPIVT